MERTTASDALIDLPEPVVEVEREAEVESEVEVVTDPAAEAVGLPEGPPVQAEEPIEPSGPIVELAGVDVELEQELLDDPADARETEAELAGLVAEAESLAEPGPETEPEPGPEPEPEPEVIAEPRSPVPASSAGPAHELVTEPSHAADVAASDAFRDLVGSTGSIPIGTAVALSITGLRKRYGSVAAVDGVDLAVPAGSFYGIVGPNGAGKTTILSMITGLLRPDEGTVAVYGHDVWRDPESARRALGVLPDRLRLFDRLTGAQLLAYTGSLRGMDRAVIARRTRDLATAFGLAASLERPVSDYSLGMTKKIAIAAALLHAPRMLVLDEPFESVDPVSSAAVLAVLRRFVASGGTVVLSSHSMALIESACDRLAIIADGRVLAEGATSDVLAGVTLEDRFVELAGGRSAVEGMEWLHSYTER